MQPSSEEEVKVPPDTGPVSPPMSQRAGELDPKSNEASRFGFKSFAILAFPGSTTSSETVEDDVHVITRSTGSSGIFSSEDIYSSPTKKSMSKRCSDCPAYGFKDSWRQKIHSTFDHPGSSPIANFVQSVGMLLIIFSTIAYMLETVEDIAGSRAWPIIEYIVSIWFAFEYLCRLLVSKNIRRFVLKWSNVIDLLAILPFFITIASGNNSSVKALRVFRIIRLVRLFRLLKIAKYLHFLTLFVESVLASMEAFLVLIVFLLITVIICAAIMHALEKGTLNPEDGIYYREDGSRSPFTSIPATAYWAVTTLTTVGFGDITPSTPAGRFFACVVMVLGLMSFALPLAVVGNNFQILYNQKKEEKKIRHRMKKSVFRQDVLFFELLKLLDNAEAHVEEIVKELRHLIETRSGKKMDDHDVSPQLSTISINIRALKTKFLELESRLDVDKLESVQKLIEQQ